MEKEKKELTPLQYYNKQKRNAKILKILAPITFWVLLILSFVALYFAFKNSFGNIAEILDLLDGDKYTSNELEAHYEYLVGKYGIWNIGSGGSGFQMKFIDIGKALFSGFAITNGIIFIVFFIGAFVLGKYLMPRLSKKILENNQDKVNIIALKKEEENK